ncbi:unnamed protein product [Closterium sp. NIES-65]|nr:unnamed protein product [Closterium sp. NIES-65]
MGEKWVTPTGRPRPPKGSASAPSRLKSISKISLSDRRLWEQERRRLMRAGRRPGLMENEEEGEEDGDDDSETEEEEEDSDESDTWCAYCCEPPRLQSICAFFFALMIFSALLVALFSAAGLINPVKDWLPPLGQPRRNSPPRPVQENEPRTIGVFPLLPASDSEQLAALQRQLEHQQKLLAAHRQNEQSSAPESAAPSAASSTPQQPLLQTPHQRRRGDARTAPLQQFQKLRPFGIGAQGQTQAVGAEQRAAELGKAEGADEAGAQRGEGEAGGSAQASAVMESQQQEQAEEQQVLMQEQQQHAQAQGAAAGEEQAELAEEAQAQGGAQEFRIEGLGEMRGAEGADGETGAGVGARGSARVSVVPSSLPVVDVFSKLDPTTARTVAKLSPATITCDKAVPLAAAVSSRWGDWGMTRGKGAGKAGNGEGGERREGGKGERGGKEWPYLLMQGRPAGLVAQEQALLRAVWVAKAVGAVLVLPPLVTRAATGGVEQQVEPQEQGQGQQGQQGQQGPAQQGQAGQEGQQQGREQGLKETGMERLFSTHFFITHVSLAVPVLCPILLPHQPLLIVPPPPPGTSPLHLFPLTGIWVVPQLPGSVWDRLPTGVSGDDVDALLALPGGIAQRIPRGIVAASGDAESAALAEWLQSMGRKTKKGEVRLLVYNSSDPISFTTSQQPQQQQQQGRVRKNALAALRVVPPIASVTTQLLHLLRKAYQARFSDLSRFHFAALHLTLEAPQPDAAGGSAGAALAAASLQAAREALLTLLDPSRTLLYVIIAPVPHRTAILRELAESYQVVTRDDLISDVSSRFPEGEVQTALEQGVAKEAAVFMGSSTDAFSRFVFELRCFTRPLLGRSQRATVFYDLGLSVAPCRVDL